MALIDMVAENIVKVPLESKDKPDVLRELVQILKDAGEIDDFDTVLSAVQEREDKGSTGLEKSIAVPHAKSAAVSSLKLAIGISPEGIDFDALDKQPSKLFFLLVAAFCRALVNADSAAEVVELLKGE
ncbi:MAG: PTS sugar transporter subunit IIA [Planctomycetota bacterium]|jgi:mannitol/fructose-specific phosphotransferase system IIA component (Ntr-type)